MNDTPRTDAFWDRMPFGRPFLSEVRKFARQLERELAEARRQEKIHFDNCASIREQRDRLAEALREVLEDHAQAGCISIEAQEVAEAALDAVKGGDNE